MNISSFYLLAWWLINVSPAWYTIYSNKKIKPDSERDLPKFQPFVRIDYEHWSYVTVAWTHILFWPRVFLGFLLWFAAALALFLVTGRNPPQTPNKKWIVEKLIRIFSYLIMFTWGYVSQKRKRIKYDYSKWLGPNYI